MAEKKKLSSIIARENKICDVAIRRLAGKCGVFEEKYNLSSNDFYDRFQKGIMGDDIDFFEWKALIDGMREWELTKDEPPARSDAVRRSAQRPDGRTTNGKFERYSS